jgi:hypothetical protein
MLLETHMHLPLKQQQNTQHLQKKKKLRRLCHEIGMEGCFHRPIDAEPHNIPLEE